ncbi:protein jagunal homolog 1 isoform X2 [Lampetra fluviatilis]
MASAATRTVASKNERARRETKADGEDKLRSSLESEVRMLVYVHVVLWALVLLQVIVSSLRLVPSSLVARPYLWEYPYLLSVAPALLTISAMRRRSTYRMVLAMAMTSLVSLGPLVYGSVEMFPMARQLYTQAFPGQPSDIVPPACPGPVPECSPRGKCPARNADDGEGEYKQPRERQTRGQLTSV